MGCGGGLLVCETAKIAVHATHETEAAEGYDFARVFAQQTEVFTEWFTHASFIQEKPRFRKENEASAFLLTCRCAGDTGGIKESA